MKPASAERARLLELDTPPKAASLVDILQHRAAAQPNDIGYIFLPDRGGAPIQLSYAKLYVRSRAVALRLAERGKKGDRAALLFPSGLHFFVTFLGCLIAGVIAVPMMIPRRDSTRDATAAILADCSPRFAISCHDLITGARPDLGERLANVGVERLLIDSP